MPADSACITQPNKTKQPALGTTTDVFKANSAVLESVDGRQSSRSDSEQWKYSLQIIHTVLRSELPGYQWT